VLDRHYDKEKKQSRNTRVVIGTDISHIYPDMMLTGKRYHEFFDTAGNLLPQYLPDKLKEEKQKKTQKEKNMAEENKTEMHPEEKITETEENKENMAPDFLQQHGSQRKCEQQRHCLRSGSAHSGIRGRAAA